MADGPTDPRLTRQGLDAIRSRHAEKRSWPVTRHDRTVGPDGYIHYCAGDKALWPCDTVRVLAALDDCTASLDAAREREKALQDKAREWHRTGVLTDAEYGAVCAVLYVDGAEPAGEQP